MIERLQRALEHVENLSPEAQADLAQQIEDMAGPAGKAAEPETTVSEEQSAVVRRALELAGAWSDLADDDEFVALDRIRHASAPTPPVEEELAWLDDDGRDD